MNKITFKAIDRHRYASGYEETIVNIYVDDKPLAETVGAYEKRFAEKEGHPDLAGDYHGIGIASSSLEQYYLGYKEAIWGDEDNKTELLGCGINGCWPLLCKITIKGEKVIWTEFEQLHRDEDWDYSDFESFEFDKRQYMNAIDAIKKPDQP